MVHKGFISFLRSHGVWRFSIATANLLAICTAIGGWLQGTPPSLRISNASKIPSFSTVATTSSLPAYGILITSRYSAPVLEQAFWCQTFVKSRPKPTTPQERLVAKPGHLLSEDSQPRSISHDRWGAGMLGGNYFVSISKGSKLAFSTNWRKDLHIGTRHLRTSQSAHSTMSVVQCALWLSDLRFDFS
ncbi:hypothetical protein K437DRAFT_262323 [Tilletiaria anomala UBC 951]|uniref:Uncharacterized protein n=1 Tax=Tilletiaria anomala (strain ATCC 24038 / CBS 436.72 / UBC 951) TaxID=1037660 RepID=A0A066W6Q7_TILAU|nr:uncharacterized protein K437DRAFT_262323 [Tilletiaria anomala UBC 951]KDN48228.1 hypothetical protein K437DRAFT_262323 [Tilletiaria anomala UBC 951]